jgi:hypothetical protein
MVDPLLNPIAEYFVQLKEQLQEIDNMEFDRTDISLLDILKEHRNKLNNLINNFDMYTKDAESTITHIDELLRNPISGGRRKRKTRKNQRRKSRKYRY